MGAGVNQVAWGYPSTEWFNDAVNKDVALAPTPGTENAAAMSWYGRIHIPQSGWIDAIHFHLDVDGTSGQYDLEIFCLRSSVFTKIATVTKASGGGDFGFANFTFVSEALKHLERGDYILLQATAKMGGSPVGFVDIHFDRTRL